MLWHCRSTALNTRCGTTKCMHGYVDCKLKRARSSDFKASNTNSNPGRYLLASHLAPIVINRLYISRWASTRNPGSRLLSITACTFACASCSRSTTLFLAKMPSYLIGRYALNDHTLLLVVVLLS